MIPIPPQSSQINVQIPWLFPTIRNFRNMAEKSSAFKDWNFTYYKYIYWSNLVTGKKIEVQILG
jgi:hypothetical protein